MRRCKTLLAIIAIMAIGWPSSAQETTANAPEALGKIVTYKFGESREPLSVVADLVRDALAVPEKRQVLAGELAAILATDATLDCKQFVCRQLALIGGAENVQALAPLLTSPDTADMARYALERIPGAEADAALIVALAAAPAVFKVGIINSLGERGCADAVDELGPLAVHADPVVAEAAIAALGKIGGAKADEALAKAEVGAELVQVVANARLDCAAQYLAQGKKKPAAAIYEDLFVPNAPRPVRVAALKGLVTAKGAKGVDLVIAALDGKDAALHGVALGLVRGLPGAKATRAFVKQLPKMSPEAQVLMINAVADREDKPAWADVVDAANGEDEGVRLAVLDALGRLGDGAAVPMLAEAAGNADNDADSREAAGRSLNAMGGEDVDAAIVAHLSKAAPPARTALIRSAAERSIATATPLLLDAATDEHEAVRTAAFEALSSLAEEQDLPTLVALLIGAQDEQRGLAEKAVVAVSRKVAEPNQRGAAVLAALPEVTDGAVRCSLLKVLGELGDNSALDPLRVAVKDESAEVRDAAVRALVDWPNIAALDDLLQIAKTAGNDKHRALALRGYVRLLAMPSDRPAAETTQRYEDALGMAANPDEKKAVLGSLAEVKCPGALHLAARCVDDEAVAAEAVAAALQIARGISGAHRDEAEAAVSKIHEQATDETVRTQAREILDFIRRFDDYVVAWEVSGPYVQEGKDRAGLFDAAFPPEDPKATGAVWDVMPPATTPDKPWLMSLDVLWGGTNRAAYFRTCVVAPSDQEARVELGSDDGVKVWLNGELVHANDQSRGCNPGEDKFNVRLKQGKNPMLVKITQGSGEWALCMRLRAPDGGGLAGVETRLP